MVAEGNSLIFAPASPTQPAPVESPRVGTQQGYMVVAV
jgi:hypothetical protein